MSTGLHRFALAAFLAPGELHRDGHDGLSRRARAGQGTDNRLIPPFHRPPSVNVASPVCQGGLGDRRASRPVARESALTRGSRPGKLRVAVEKRLNDAPAFRLLGRGVF